jgi:glyoxylase-like metal-dependent hydrolase (beta-lactamase superfamily II)
VESIAEIENWYRVFQIESDLFMVHEPGHVTFFVYRSGSHALFVDTGLGLSESAADKLLEFLGIKTFDAVCTHAHCDHIGLNYRARRIYISKAEWEKYSARNDREQLRFYYEGLKTIMQWPAGYKGGTETRVWKPTNFVEDRDTVELGGAVLLSVLFSKGHTVGSIMLQDKNRGYLYTGDLIYTGMMYLNLKDSDYDAFKESIQLILELQKQNVSLQIWPSHNKIPLPGDYPAKVQGFISRFEAGSPEISTAPVEKNEIFEAGMTIRGDHVKMMVKQKRDMAST